MTRRLRKQRGGLDYLEDAALVGLGAYAARNPQAPGSSIVLNGAKWILYIFAGLFALFVAFFIIVLLVAPKGNKPVAQTDQKTTTPPTH